MDSIFDPITETDEQKFCVEIMKRLNIQRRNEQFCDVILEVGSGDDQARLNAQRIVLCAGSPFFYNALHSDMKEKKEGVIRLKEMSKAVMEEMLEYLYTGHANISEHNAFDLLAAADYFLISSLKVLCNDIILQSLSLSNCIRVYNLAVKYRCEEVLKQARDFALGNFVAVAETEDFLNLSSTQVEEWISSDQIVVKEEEEVFEAIVKWMERNESQKQRFYDLFRHIRCIYVHRDYLLNFILINPFVKDNLECSSLALDAMKMVFRGQQECYFAQSPRNCLKTHEDSIVACGIKTTLCYIPSENKWYELPDLLSTRRYYSHNITTCQGKLYCVGGINEGNSAERYDPSENTWSPLKSFQQRMKFCSVVTFQGLVYVIGGVDKDNHRLSTVQRYNPDTNVWKVMLPLSSPRSSVCAVADEKHLYAIGGASDSGYLAIAERFDPTERAWSSIAPSIEKRIGAGGTAVNHKVFVFGGLMDNKPGSKVCEMYEPSTDMWSVIATVFLPLKHKVLSVTNFKGKIFVCVALEQGYSQKRLSLQVYDTATTKWTSCTDFPRPRIHFNMSSLRMPREVLSKCKLL